MIGCLAYEVVRRVAALAVHARVKLRVFGGGLVAATARARIGVDLSAAGMRVVTTDAAAGSTGLRMVGVHVAVTLGAGLLGAATHVMRGVAIHTLLMARRVGTAERGEVLVARAARSSLLFTELVGTMAAHALAMASSEQRRLRDDWLLFCVTRNARPQGFRGRRVLFLVAGGAGLDDRFAGRCVSCHDVFVAVGAGSRNGLGVFVRAVAVEALFGVVNLHGWCRALCRQVTMRTLASSVGVRRKRVAAGQRLERVNGGIFGEAVAEHAVALAPPGETSSGFVRRV